ncbi:MAG: hypothetical protein KDC98_18950 [Planctomycetes bacterium]|nr:hypothetical protein [Planctomycetota bacterium]
MTDSPFMLRRLVERVLESGPDLPLGLLLEQLVAVKQLRELARKFDLSPKGFRVDRAPAKVLASQLAELRDGEQLDEVLALLRPSAGPKPAAKPDVGRLAELEALLGLRAEELRRQREELERAREYGNRARDREAELHRRNELLEDEVTRLRRDREHAARTAVAPVADRSQVVRALERRLRELEGEREGVFAADEALRRQLALNQSRMRQLEAANAELEELIPKSRRRKKKPLPPLPEEERRVLVPYFLPSFYKSLVGKERKAVERAVHAILLFCTEGHAYPGLECKQLGGQDTWSLRASLGLRIYFRPLPDGDIEVLELGDREDQNTTLRRLKER